jgi:hypothetical protein
MTGDFRLPILFLLGCYHGINPGMGWLFAVSFGLADRSMVAVLRAIVPIAIGHVVSIAIVVALAVFASVELPPRLVHAIAGGVLLAFGAYRLLRARHPRWVGMQVGFWGLALWGLLMSTAHGAGLMLVPFVTMAHTGAMPEPYAQGLLMVAVHTLGYLISMTAVALVIYAKFGVSFLRTAWFNVDLIWAVALLLTGIIAFIA